MFCGGGRRATSEGRTSDVGTGVLRTSNNKMSPFRGMDTIDVLKNYQEVWALIMQGI